MTLTERRRARVIACGSVLLSLGAGTALSRDDRSGPQACLGITPDAARLACYDREVRSMAAPRFAGRLHKTTEPFRVEGPTLLRYQSDGPIFVLYLKSPDNRVLQNLHIGGGGEASYLIEEPGTYVLDVNGSESWRIWLEPQTSAKTN
ncbi:hypothetical protein [Hyphomicrobium sp.]|uniref:hypothetical protein n=1 Tax=Hyphomicrobium sp. TaxID=82 RepID=UPI0025BB815F|nr:hypothetical protein [Hyphomicrobium sp.]MCC7252281.1 hypothetical protein [Hyphomicrobium sp.]